MGTVLLDLLDLRHEPCQVYSLRFGGLVSFSTWWTSHEAEIVLHHFDPEHLLLDAPNVIFDGIKEVHSIRISSHHLFKIIVEVHPRSGLIRL